MVNNSYALPQQIYEWSSGYGQKLEYLRRSLLDLLFKHNFQYVHPPILEYQKTLSLGSGKLSGDQAFRFADPISGKMLAIRTDISPQISRMDYVLNKQSQQVEKYCYAGEIVLAQVDSLAIRNPYQVGAEIFGDSSIQADIEAINIALECCQISKQTDLLLDIGHTGILKTAIDKLELSSVQETQLIDILQRKSYADSKLFIAENQLNTMQQNIISLLFESNQTGDDYQMIESKLYDVLPECKQKWLYLNEMSAAIKSSYPNIRRHMDLAELRGYSYHTGVVFGIYSENKLICRGGRYNHSLSSNYRTATGFTLDVNSLNLEF